MASIDALRASDGSENANLATVQSTRSGGASTIVVDTVTGIPDNFYGSMGTPHTFVDPVTSETITVISEDTAVDFKGHVDGTNLEIDDIAPGYVDGGSAVGDIVIIKPTTQWADDLSAVLAEAHDDDGKLQASAPITGGYDLSTLINGWIDATSETWEYVSGSGTVTGVFKVSGVDLTSKYQAGDRLKFTQGGNVKYAIIMKVAFSTDTTFTLLMSATSGTADNSGLTNAAITANYYSRVKAPFGFPLDPARWTITVSSSSSRSISGTSFGSLTDAIAVPIGAWILSLKATLLMGQSTTASRRATVILSSNASSETDSELTLVLQRSGESSGSQFLAATMRSQKNINLAAATTFTLMGKLDSTASSTTASVDAAASTPTVIKAICAYL